MRNDLPEDNWRKSSYSEANGGQCVEMQRTPEGLVALGDSKDRSQGAHTFSPTAWASFVAGVKAGEFDQ